MNDPERRAKIFMGLSPGAQTEDVLAEMFAEVGDAARRHGERWTEIALAHWISASSLTENEEVRKVLLRIAEQVTSREWRGHDFLSAVDLTEYAVAAGLVEKGR